MKIVILACSFVLLATVARGQARSTITESAMHFPRVIRADVPLYPPVPWSAHFGGTVEIEITVENGSVTNAVIRREDLTGAEKSNVPRDEPKLLAYLSTPALQNVRTWKFELDRPTMFVVTYVYRIAGEETSLPENPTVTLALPTAVTVTAKPFKPTVSSHEAER